ncbi:MAG: MCP four helix bundle domain-containing protein [Spirochaetes bacterium]|nr:MCP four helix bundle domain-containing protein [Spirochaetota bacterium]
MKWFNNLGVSFKVLICCLVFLSIISVLAVQSYMNSKAASEHFKTFYDTRFDTVKELNINMKNILQRRINMIQIVEALKVKNDAEVKARVEDSEKLGAINEKIWKKYIESSMSEEEKKLAMDYRADVDAALDSAKKFYTAVENKDILEAEKQFAVWTDFYRKFRDKMEVLIEFQAQQAKKILEEQNHESEQTSRIILIAWVVSVLVGIIITILLAYSVKKPVQKGLIFAQKLSEGDFRERIDLDQKDELGVLAKALNKTADNLEKLIADIITAAQNLTQAVNEISSGNQNLSQRTSEQASSLEEIASTIEETTATINQNADNSTQADKLSKTTTTEAEDGGRVVYEAVAAINDISESSKKIEDIINVINEISFQTNLLALNAAVEAARAGEQGRGFAVVAGEVRNLAQRSGTAAKEIAELIKDSRNKVSKGTELANKSGEALKMIVESVRSVGKYVSEIAAASEEQRQGVSQINVAVEELDSMTQQNAGLVEETASASEEMANQAQELLAMMEKFKIRDELKTETYAAKHKELHLKSAQAKKVIPSSKNEKSHAEASERKTQDKAQKGSIEEILTNEGFEEF